VTPFESFVVKKRHFFTTKDSKDGTKALKGSKPLTSNQN
jgi:hypothetical protein